MKTILKSAIALPLVTIILACGKKAESKNVDDNRDIRSNFTEQNDTFSYGFTDDTITDLENFIASAKNCDDPNLDLCQKTNLKLKLRPSDLSKESVMILDEVGQWPMLGKYRNRTASYIINIDGSITEHVIDAKISVGMNELLNIMSTAKTESQLTDGFAQYQLKTSKVFEAIKKNKIFSNDLQSLGLFGHGTPIFGFLAENIPDVNLIVVNQNNLLPAESLCNWHEGSLEKRMRTIANNLNFIAMKHHTQYVNLSFGYSFSLIKNQLNQKCNQNPSDKVIIKMLEEIHIFFESLGENSNLALFQAVNENNEDWQSHREVSDCSRNKKNRFRVAYSYTDKDALLEDNFAVSLSEAKPNLIPQHIKERLKCADLILDSESYAHFNLTENPFIFGADGLLYGTYMNFFLTTSYVTPVALTYMRHLSKKYNLNPINTYDEITESGTKKMLHWGRSERKL